MCVRPRQSHGSKCDSWRTILVWFAAPKFMGLVRSQFFFFVFFVFFFLRKMLFLGVLEKRFFGYIIN